MSFYKITRSVCLMCGAKLPREIQQTGIHHITCLWNYYIECNECHYQNNIAKLLGFFGGCSVQCKNERRKRGE